MGKQSCWEFLECPETRRQECRAFLENRGTECWLVTGTRYRGEELPNLEQKILKCRECSFYNYIVFDEQSKGRTR